MYCAVHSCMLHLELCQEVERFLECGKPITTQSILFSDIKKRVECVYVMLFHMTSHHIMSSHIMSCHVMSCHIYDTGMYSWEKFLREINMSALVPSVALESWVQIHPGEGIFMRVW